MHRLHVFGGLSIQTGRGPLEGRAAQRRRLALLALLASTRAGLMREKLISYLWPEANGETGRHFLSDSVYRINEALGGDVIVAAGDEVRLDPLRLPSDVADFSAAIAATDHERAVACHRGPFLDGFFLSNAPAFERWADVERDRFGREYASALEALAAKAARDGRHTDAASWWRQLAAHDPYVSRTALGLMRALDASGERAEAIRHARLHETLLREELELEPDHGVRTFAEALRRGGGVPDRGAENPRTGADEEGAPEQATSHPRPDDACPPPPRAHDTASPTGPTQAPIASRRHASLRRLVTAGTIALGGVALWLGLRELQTTAAAMPPRAVAVLPFASLSPDPADEYFSDGITEELIATLARVPDLRVASRTSAFAFKGKSVDVREVGERLDVDAVIEGSVRKAGETLRITTRLVSTADGHMLWAKEYDRELHDVLSIQEEIAEALVSALRGAASGTGLDQLHAQSPRDPEAYDLYLRGRFAWHQRTRNGLLLAIDYFELAVAVDPEYARAWVGLADAYAVGAFYDYVAPRTAYPRAERAARRALEIDAGLAAPHATLGYIFTYYHLDWPRAEAAFKRATAIDPGYSTAHQWYGNLLTVAGRFAEAELEMRRAQEVDPLSLIAHTALGWSYFFAGRAQDALEQFRLTLALEPEFELAHLWSGWALHALNRRDEAREAIGRAVTLSGGSVLTRLALAHLLAGADMEVVRDSAKAMLGEIEARAAAGEYVPSYEIGRVYLALGDREAALRWLEQAAEERSHSIAFLDVDPYLSTLRSEPRFAGLAARITR